VALRDTTLQPVTLSLHISSPYTIRAFACPAAMAAGGGAS